MRININEQFECELTISGAKVYNQHYLEYPADVRPATVGAGDKIELELWQMMTIFGAHLHHGGDVMFKENAVTMPNAKLARAERALVRAGFEGRGGEDWAPPLGHPPGFVPVNGWLIDGSLVYRLDETESFNVYEINVTQAEGKRGLDGPRTALAQKIRAMLVGMPIPVWHDGADLPPDNQPVLAQLRPPRKNMKGQYRVVSYFRTKKGEHDGPPGWWNLAADNDADVMRWTHIEGPVNA